MKNRDEYVDKLKAQLEMIFDADQDAEGVKP